VKKHNHTCPVCRRLWKHQVKWCVLKMESTCPGCIEVRAMEFPAVKVLPPSAPTVAVAPPVKALKYRDDASLAKRRPGRPRKAA